MQDYTSLSQMLKTASLDDIFEQVQEQVKAHPQSLQAREVLFKLYCVEGLWDKALLQLQTLAMLDDALKKRTELYKNLVFSEMQRGQVLAGERQAATLEGARPQWMEALHQANALHYQGETERAEKARLKAFDLAQGSPGRSDTLGEFSWIADSDSRLGPVCEFICAGGYRWLPFSTLQQLNVSRPEDLLDLLWIPATAKAGDEIYHGYIPARYPVSEVDDRDSKLGLKTQWASSSDTFSPASGRKVLITDRSEHSIMEAGDIVFG
jgi:type VI secretion system protein ImpE